MVSLFYTIYISVDLIPWFGMGGIRRSYAPSAELGLTKLSTCPDIGKKKSETHDSLTNYWLIVVIYL